jgi:hypothetical protein
MNGANTMPEYLALWDKTAARFPFIGRPDNPTRRFCLENAPAFLEPHFTRTEVYTLPGMLRFPTAQPFIDYFASSRALSMPPGHTEAQWQAVLDFVRAEAEAIIAQQGHFDVTKITGAVIGVKGD